MPETLRHQSRERMIHHCFVFIFCHFQKPPFLSFLRFFFGAGPPFFTEKLALRHQIGVLNLKGSGPAGQKTWHGRTLATSIITLD